MTKTIAVLLSLCILLSACCNKKNSRSHSLPRDQDLLQEDHDEENFTDVMDGLIIKKCCDLIRGLTFYEDSEFDVYCNDQPKKYKCVGLVENYKWKNEEQISKAIEKFREVIASNVQILCAGKENMEHFYGKTTEDLLKTYNCENFEALSKYCMETFNKEFFEKDITTGGLIDQRLLEEKAKKEKEEKNNCKGDKCRAGHCFGDKCQAGDCEGDECWAGDCNGDSCQAGSCKGDYCTAGDCYGPNCKPGVCEGEDCYNGTAHAGHPGWFG